jgi:hypothetical protein
MKWLITAVTLLSSIEIFAQDDSLRHAVENYRGRSNILLPNARQMMIDKLDSGRMEDVRQLFTFLMKELRNSDLQLFYSSERTILSYYVNDFEPLLKYFAKGKSNVEGAQPFAESHSRYSYYAPYLNDQLERVLFERTAREFEPLCAQLQQTALHPEEKAVLQLYLRYRLPATAGPAFSNDSVFHHGSAFVKQYPQSRFLLFVNRVVVHNVRRPKGMVGLSIGGGAAVMGKGIATQFRNPFLMSADLHYLRNKWLFSGHFRAGASKLASDLLQNNMVLWQKGRTASSIFVGGFAGRVLVNSERLLLAPQLGLGHSSFFPSEDEIKENPALRGLKIKSAGLRPIVSLLVMRKPRRLYDDGNEIFAFHGLRLNYEWQRYETLNGTVSSGIAGMALSYGILGRFSSSSRGYVW